MLDVLRNGDENVKKIIINDYNLKESDMTEVVKRVKILLINSNNEILLGNSYNEYQFPGGHVEENETLINAVNREIKEETGIILNLTNVNPFACQVGYYKDWPEIGKNRKIEIYYYELKNNSLTLLANGKIVNFYNCDNECTVYENYFDNGKILLQENNITIPVNYEICSNELMYKMIKEKIGIGYVITENIQSNIDKEFEYVKLLEDCPVLHICVAYIDKIVPSSVKNFIELLEEINKWNYI